MNPRQLALEKLQNSRDLAAQRTADRYDSQSELSGQYAGYNAASGNMVIATPSGTVTTKSISNGMTQPGEIVTVSAPRGGMAQSGQMPSS
jgi:uncharacterized protein YgiB involved in biofilm formation